MIRLTRLNRQPIFVNALVMGQFGVEEAECQAMKRFAADVPIGRSLPSATRWACHAAFGLLRDPRHVGNVSVPALN